MSEKVNVGELAPDFLLLDDDDKIVSLKSFDGKAVVIYFYPKDDTPGCCKEAVDFTAKAAEFNKADVAILGVSCDSVDSHAKFKKKHDLSIQLLADVGHRMSEAYGTWIEKSMFGKKYMGMERSTFLLDKNKKIVKIWRKVKVWGHVEDVLSAALSL